MKVVIPFRLSYNPMMKLAIINFEKNPDEVYKGLELQCFDDKVYGKGYRVIAYRCDGYVDVYDDMNLNRIDDENFDVAGKGLCERKRVVIKNVEFEKTNGCISISFEFFDKSERKVVAKIYEKTTKKTNGINLLAPIGVSSQNPSALPLFFLYDLDFVRKNKTIVELTIDGKIIKQDNFPVLAPKDFQWRYYSRYAPDCQIVELANSKKCVLEEYEIDEGKLVQGQLEYQYTEDVLKKITLKQSEHKLYMKFDIGLPNILHVDEDTKYIDTFKIIAEDTMGYVSGEYSVERQENSVKIVLNPSDGWKAVPNSLLTKAMFGKKSVFCSWPKTYRYIQNIDITTLNSNSYWERIEL